MRIWIENPFDNLPAEGFRPQRYWLMARAFVDAGHEVVYWTSSFNHTTKQKRRLITRPQLETDKTGRKLPEFIDNGVRVVLLYALPYSNNVSLTRVLSHRGYAKQWNAYARNRADELGHPDLIVTSAPPLATGDTAITLARHWGARLIVDVMDAWPNTFYRLLPRGLRWAGKFLFAPFHWAANRLYASADRVSGVCDRYGEMVRAAGASEYARFYHGITIGSAKPPRPRNGASEVHLVYVGNLGITYDLATVIAAVKGMDGVTLDIAGKGATLLDLQRLAEGCDRVRFHGYLNGDELAALLANSDIGIVPMKADSFVGVPYKFGDYSAAGLAIVSSLCGESAALLDRYGAGAVYGSVESFKAAVSSLLPRLDVAKAASRLMAETEFDAKRIYEKYVRWAIPTDVD